MSNHNVSQSDFNAALSSMVQRLLQLDIAYREDTGALGLPHDASPAMRDFAEQPRFATTNRQQPIDNVHTLLRLVTFAGFDHLRSFARLFQSDVTPVYTHHVVARAALQAFGYGAWLAEPGLDVGRRVKRGLLLDLVDALNRKRYGMPEIRAGSSQIITDVRATAAHQGWIVIANEKTQSIDGDSVPSTASLIGTAIGPKFNPGIEVAHKMVWAYISGIAHSFSFALLQSVHADPSSSSVAPGLVPGSVAIDTQSVQVAGIAVANAAITAGGRHLKYMGWPTTQWDQAVTSLKSWARPMLAKTRH